MYYIWFTFRVNVGKYMVTIPCMDLCWANIPRIDGYYEGALATEHITGNWMQCRIQPSWILPRIITVLKNLPWIPDLSNPHFWCNDSHVVSPCFFRFFPWFSQPFAYDTAILPLRSCEETSATWAIGPTVTLPTNVAWSTLRLSPFTHRLSRILDKQRPSCKVAKKKTSSADPVTVQCYSIMISMQTSWWWCQLRPQSLAPPVFFWGGAQPGNLHKSTGCWRALPRSLPRHQLLLSHPNPALKRWRVGPVPWVHDFTPMMLEDKLTAWKKKPTNHPWFL